MGILNKIFKIKPDKQPEDYYEVTITDDFVKVEHPKRKTESVQWNEIIQIKLINTNTGPWGIDIWMALIGENSGCLIPHGSDGFEKVYNIVSKYNGFDFDNFIQSMSCAENKEFPLWKKGA